MISREKAIQIAKKEMPSAGYKVDLVKYIKSEKLNDTHQFSFDFKALIPFVNEFQTFFGYQFLIEKIPDNSTIEINNSTTNNSTITIPEYQNNDTEIQYNDTIISEEEIVKDTSTSDAPNILGIDKKTGTNLWMIGGLIILGALILVLKD